MRWSDLTESAFKHVTPLSAMAKEVLSHITYSIDETPVEIMRPFSDNFIETMKSYGEGYVELCQYINKYVPITIYNGRSRNRLNGAYNHSPDMNNPLQDNIQVFLVPKMEYKPIQRSTDVKQSKEIQTTLVHELRHVMQRISYSRYYHRNEISKTEFDYATGNYKGYNYKTDPTEIDAAFMHLLYQEDADNVQDFVNSVMEKFTAYKELTPRWEKHYRRKAAKYFYDMNAAPDQPVTTPRDRFTAKQEAAWKSVCDRILAVDISPLHNLTNIGAPVEGRFFFPADRFRAGLVNLLNGKLTNRENQYMILVFLAFMKRLDPGIDTNAVLSRYDISRNEVLEFAENHDWAGFNQPFIVDCVRSM